MKYADVILPLPLQDTYTYALPVQMQGRVSSGCRVIVPFGAKKFYTAVVERLHDDRPQGYEVKEVQELLDDAPVLLPVQLDFWKWIAGYYYCALGEVFKAAFPSGMKLESESSVRWNEDSEGEAVLTPREQAVADVLLRESAQTLQQLQKAVGGGDVCPVVRALMVKGLVVMREEVKRNYKPRTEIHVRLSEAFFSEATLHQAFDELARAPKQAALLARYVELAGVSAALRLQNRNMLSEVSRKVLLEASGTTLAVSHALVERGILETYAYEIGRLARSEVADVIGVSPLSEAQQRAFVRIKESFGTHRVCLLHGVTSSGKTEVYIHLIKEMMEQGRQVLYLVPEIVLTTQLTDRLYRVFGTRMGVYHSKFPDAERVEIWKKQLSDKPYDLIVGVRSSVFLPFRRLGLVIVDEEHEQSYKQQEPAPRYHARNAAVVLACRCGAQVLLGSATPAIETYYNVQRGKYALVELTERFGRVQLPEVELVDIKELQHKRRMSGPFSPVLLGAVRQALERHEQAILFQNRRGYAPMIECHTCGWVPKCRNCDVSLTYHREADVLTCHYCGFTCKVPTTCPACGESNLVQRGYGTEKIADEIQRIFPEAAVARLDLDTTRTRTAYEGILSAFQEGKTDILIGTQMVTKGLDFERVSVVGILNADTMLSLPDFRSFERGYQLMAQVAGRAGRRQVRGRVILQTKSPELPVIRQVMAHDYAGMFADQLEERRMFVFPPFCRLIYVYMKHRKSEVLDRMARDMAVRLRAVFGRRVFGPDVPPVSRIQLLYIRKIVLKMEPEASVDKVRENLLAIRRGVWSVPEFRSGQIYFDVDPM